MTDIEEKKIEVEEVITPKKNFMLDRETQICILKDD